MHVHFFFSLFPRGHLYVRICLENLESLNKLPSTRVFITAKQLMVRITQRLLELELSSEREPAALKMVKKYTSFSPQAFGQEGYAEKRRDESFRARAEETLG